MRILLTGATGYIGKRLLPSLINAGHHVICCVRDKHRFNPPDRLLDQIETIEVDFLKSDSLQHIPEDIDGAYYLMHSMSSSSDYESLELRSARNFRERLDETKVTHVIYLSGIVNSEELSRHLSSRKQVEDELGKGNFHFTALRAGIIIGSGSASFEIIRDLVEKLPAMIAPRWLRTQCQPISIRDVINFLEKTIFQSFTYDKDYDIGGPDILNYREMLLGYAEVRGLRRKIWIVPVMTPHLSSYWLYFVTSTSIKLAAALVNSMKVEVICRPNDLAKRLEITPIGYDQALRNTLQRIEENQIISSWKDSWISGRINRSISDFLKVPTYGCFVDKKERKVDNKDECIDRIWRIGGNTGWYHWNLLWKIRGFMDKLAGGVGLRRGRTHPDKINTGDAVDFWRVLYANRQEGRLLLFAEMKLPGEAWLEFKMENQRLIQTATFRPKGIWGRLYWFAVLPLHGIIFNGMINKLAGV